MRRLLSREFLIALLISAAAFWFAFRYVKPAPPKSFVISAATKGAPYYQLATRLHDWIAKSGVDAVVRTSEGSFDNLKRLEDPDSDVQAALLQGGISNRIESPNLDSMGRLITEPVWVFYRGDEKLDRLTQLQGKRILIGPQGSGTNFLARKLLDANGITDSTATLVPMELPAYIEAFTTGNADAGFLVIGTEAKTVQTLLRTPGVKLMSMAQAEGLIQRYPFLSHITLEQGVIDFGKNIPPGDTSLVATRAALVVRDDLHPALVNLLAQAVLAVQSEPAVTAGGEAKLFPIPSDTLGTDDPEYPVAVEARRVYKSGPPFLQRYLPFWVATLFDRALVLILPLIGILIPLVRIVPMLYNWRMKRRILRWYRELKNLEGGLPPSASAELIQRKEHELDRIEEAVRKISVPVRFSADLYFLRNHVEFVRGRIGHLKALSFRHEFNPLFTG